MTNYNFKIFSEENVKLSSSIKKYLRLTTWYMFSIDITLSTATLKPDAHSEYVSPALKPGPCCEYLSAALKSDPQHVERCAQIRPTACISQRQRSKQVHVVNISAPCSNQTHSMYISASKQSTACISRFFKGWPLRT